MDNNKLRIKIGDHEFEAEGPAEVVQAQLAAFKELVAATPAPKKVIEPTPEQQSQDNQQVQSPANGPLVLDKIMKVGGRIVSLTARANSLEDAVLLLLLGQKTFRNNDGVTGGEIIDGLKISGQSADRVDRVLHKVAADGNIIITGAHRGKRYRMTHPGMARAQEIARTMLSMFP